MFTRVKTPQEVADMRISGQMLSSILKIITMQVVSGMNGKDVSQIVRKELKAMGGDHAFLGYNGYPDVICISVNDAVVHGIPNATPFKEGDVVSFDYGVKYNGMITDSAVTVALGEVSDRVKNLIKTTEQAMYAGIDVLKDGVRVGNIAAAVQKVLDKEKLGIVRDLVGHGVGHYVHEDPNIPNYGVAGSGSSLRSGMTIAIEPMATLGDYQVYIDNDGWTIKTVDGSLSAHFEHTILITDKGYEILTNRD